MKIVAFSFIILGISVIPCSGGIVTIDADGFNEGQDMSAAFSSVSLSSVGGYAGLDGRVYAFGDGLATTGTKVFGNNLSFERQWFADFTEGFAFRADFLKPANYVAIDIIGDDFTGMDIGIFYVYNSSDSLLDSVLTGSLRYGEAFTAEVTRPEFDIAYIIAGGWADSGDTIHLDNLRVNVIPEPATILISGLGGLILIRKKIRF